MTNIGYDMIIKRIDEMLIEVPPLNMKEVNAWTSGAQYMKNEIVTMIESLKEDNR